MIDVEAWTGREALRLRTALRMSQRGFAAHLGVSERTVAKWDGRGAEITPRSEFQRVLDTALAQASAEAQERFRALLDDHTGTPVGQDDAKGLLNPNAPLRAVPSRASAPTDAKSDVDVESYERLVVDYAAFDNSAGPKLIVNVVTQHATTLVDQLAQARGDSWARIARLAARYAEFAGWLHQDAGDAVRAGQWTETALSIAHASGDAGMVAYTLMRRSNQAAEQHQIGTALGLADAAVNTVGARTPRIRALGYRQKAVSLALTGDLNGCVGAITRAHDEIASDPGWNPLTGYCTIHYLDAEAAQCFLRLGQPDRAVELLAPVITTWPNGYVRDREFYRAHFAEALALAGHVEAAINHTRQAAKLVTTGGSRRTAVQVNRIPGVLDEVERHQEAVDLRHELTTLMV